MWQSAQYFYVFFLLWSILNCPALPNCLVLPTALLTACMISLTSGIPHAVGSASQGREGGQGSGIPADRHTDQGGKFPG